MLWHKTIGAGSVGGQSSWDLSGAIYIGSFDTSGVTTSPQSIFVSEDGTRLYFTDTGNDDLWQYSMSTPHDMTTLSLVRVRTSWRNNSRGIIFSPDGTKMFYGSDGSDRVYTGTFSTAWDISTLSEDATSDAASSVDDVHASPDGAYLYAARGNVNYIQAYTTSTAWSLSGASQSDDTIQTDCKAITMKGDGTLLWATSSGGTLITEYSMSTPWDTSTVSATGNTYNVSSDGAGAITAMHVTTEDVYLYVMSDVDDAVHQWRIP
jgi:6-phosphogluconolactonase (cycloisomerase 2 family)